MKRAFIASSLLLFVVIFSSGFSFRDWKDSLNNQVKAEAEKSFSDLFHRKVTIQSAGGRIIGQIDLHQMSVPGLGRAEKVILSYNPIKYAWARGDMVPALSKITVVNGNIQVERAVSGEWNILSIFQGDGGKSTPPPPFRGIVEFKNCRAEINDQRGLGPEPKPFTAELSGLGGSIDLRRPEKIKFFLAATDPQPAKVKGQVEVKTGQFQLNISAKKLDLAKWAEYLNLANVNGKADIALQIDPAKTKGSLKLFRAAIWGQELDGLLKLTFRNNLLVLETDKTTLNRGTLQASLKINLGGKEPIIDYSGRVARLNLTELAQKSPGLEGLASGNLSLAGPLSHLTGKISAQLDRALVFGQKMDSFSSSFTLRNGDFYLESLNATGQEALINARGSVSRNLVFDLQAEASGLRLSGQGPLGKQQATVKKFFGRVVFKLDEYFLSSPLKNLFASGEAELVNCLLGEQRIDEAAGKLAIGGGLIIIDNAKLKNGQTKVVLTGQTGVGVSTGLYLTAPNARLDDLRIINHFLPVEMADPTGSASIEIKVEGQLPKETNFSSLEPLLDLSANASIELSQAEIAGLPIVSAKLKSTWQNRTLTLGNSTIIFPESSLQLNASYQAGGNLAAAATGTVNLDHLNKLSASYGKLGGRLGFGLTINGPIENPGFATTFWLQHFHFNALGFDQISGSLSRQDNTFSLSSPLLLKNGKDEYWLSGALTLEADHPADSSLALELRTKKISLANAWRQTFIILGEVLRRSAVTAQGVSQKVNLSKLRLSAPATDRLYHSNGDKLVTVLQNWRGPQPNTTTPLTAAPEEKLDGELTADLRLTGTLSDPIGAFTANIDNGVLRDFQFDNLNLVGGFDNQSVQMKSALLSKAKGQISASGRYQYSNDLNFNFLAKEFPLDILQVIFPKKLFKGAFNSAVTLSGPLDNVDFSVTAKTGKVSLANINYDRVDLAAAKVGDHLSLEQFTLTQGGATSSCSGEVDFSRPGSLNLRAVLKGETLGLLNLFTNQLEWKSGSSYLAANLGGTIDQPELSGSLFVRNGNIRLLELDSELQNLQVQAAVDNNILNFSKLAADWRGKTTRDVPNTLNLSGTINLNNLLAQKNSLYLDLSLQPVRLYLFFPATLTGWIIANDISLKGPLSLEYSQGPLLSGRLDLSDAVIYLSRPAAAGGKPFPLNLQLETNFAKNVYATLGDVATLDLSNVFMNLEINGRLLIGGALAEPRLAGKIMVKRGTINIFNREFTLLSQDAQKKYFPYDPSRLEDNFAHFAGEEGPEGVLPQLNITASTKIENQEKDAGGQTVKKEVNVLARLKGTLGAKEESRALKIALQGFSEDKTKSPAEMSPAAYSDQDLKVMLLPDFIKQLAGINQPGAATSNTETNAIVADYLSSRVQTLLFRSIERQAEQALGLESLKLDYNFGPSFRQAIGATQPSGYEKEKPAWTVGFTKGFFDRLYLEVNSVGYNQPQSNTNAALNAFNYQLTYKLDPVWSIIYYREPVNYYQPITGNQKISLKAGFYLW